VHGGSSCLMARQMPIKKNPDKDETNLEQNSTICEILTRDPEDPCLLTLYVKGVKRLFEGAVYDFGNGSTYDFLNNWVN
jgi:hypothetical protein